ncbi:unnamed protein product [Rotaria socialis]|uniref:Integrase catalytic domain-containing protein n=2 Tax=Rotaria socialis TaxID=392032 RepID=A0A818L1M3_9BILA|nr:unnamed protein product [Rotaria socialis]
MARGGPGERRLTTASPLDAGRSFASQKSDSGRSFASQKSDSDLRYFIPKNKVLNHTGFERRTIATEVAIKLHGLLFVFGPPRLLHSDNGRDFVSAVIMVLKSLFPDLHFIRGRPRHPQSQGCIERANGVLCDALGKWMSTNNCSSWSDGLLPIVSGINTRMSTVTKTTPYEVMFGQAPRCDSDYRKLVSKNGIDDENDLPTPVVASTDYLNDGKSDTLINFDEDLNPEVVELVKQLSDDVVSSLNAEPSISSSVT